MKSNDMHMGTYVNCICMNTIKSVSLLFIRCDIMEWAKLLQSTNQEAGM